MIEFLMVPGASTPVAPFSHVVTADGWLFVTGQMPTDPNDDGAVLPDGIEAQTRRVVENLKLVLAGVGSGLDQVVFVRVYLTHFERDYAAILFRARAPARAHLHWCYRARARRACRDRSLGAPTGGLRSYRRLDRESLAIERRLREQSLTWLRNQRFECSVT